MHYHRLIGVIAISFVVAYHHGIGLVIASASTATSTTKCTLCGDTSIPEHVLDLNKNNDNQQHQMKNHDDGNGDISCYDLYRQLENVYDNSSDKCKTIQLSAFQSKCCDETYVPDNVCTLCPSGLPYKTGIVIPGSQGRRELTCADITTEASFLDYIINPGQCSDTFLQRSAAWCQCPGTSVECTLCPDGIAPPNPYKKERVLFGWDCKSFEYVTSLLSKSECSMASELLEFDAAAFCCPNEFVSPPGVCSLCSNDDDNSTENHQQQDYSLFDPDKVVMTRYGNLKCGDIEESLSMIPTKESCTTLKNEFDPSLCCSNIVASSSSSTVTATMMTMISSSSVSAVFITTATVMMFLEQIL